MHQVQLCLRRQGRHAALGDRLDHAIVNDVRSWIPSLSFGMMSRESITKGSTRPSAGGVKANCFAVPKLRQVCTWDCQKLKSKKREYDAIEEHQRSACISTVD
eukprot:495769-Amphidinium_carterae.2